MKRYTIFSALALLALVIAACAPAATPTAEPTSAPEPTAMPDPTAMPEEEDMAKTIVDIAVEDGRFTTLVAALGAADLAGTLAGDGPFTVFAPTDDAFAALPEGTVDALLNDISALTDILLYHVVGGEVYAADVVGLDSATSLQGADLVVTIDGETVMINEFEVIITDIMGSNGVIHVVDAVLLPPEEMMEEESMEANEKDIVGTAVEGGSFSTLVAAVEAAGLVETLQGEGPFTVFAPTDEAFAALPEGTVDALLNDIPALTEILLYHVVSGDVRAEDVIELNSAETVQGESVRISTKDGSVFINEAQVQTPDVVASNGVVHVIDSVLLPPTQNIAEIAVENGSFTTLVAALDAAGLVETLQGEGPFTVFAPTDDAFAALPEGTVDALLNDIPALTDILLYHVVPGEVFSGEVVEIRYAETAQGQPVIISIEEGKVMINDAEVVLTDIQATNGVIHVIDSVILPPSKDIVETAVEDGRFSTLVAAVEAAGLVEALQGEGPLTVFAPTDDAFAALPEGTVEALLNDIPALTDILLYHVVDGQVFSSDVIELDSAETLQGESVTITVDEDGNVMVDNANIIITDILTSNGVIHVIDAVIIPAG